MKLNSLVQATERTVEGLVCEIEGLKALAFNGVNLQHEDKAVMVDCILENGERHRLFCSKAVSKGIRSKAITKEMLFGFPITVGDREDGSKIFRIEMPTSAVNNWIEVEASSLKVEEFVPSIVNYEELIA